MSTILSDILVTNEPARLSCGAPDYMLTRKGVPVGYIEAKDIGVDLNSKALKEQFDRYKAGLKNLLITDYLQFKFYKEGEFITEISIATIEDGQIKSLSGNFDWFTHLICDFALVNKVKSKEVHMQASAIFTPNDILVNRGVILAGVLVYFFDSKWPDLVIGAIVFTFVMQGAIKILKLSK